MIFVKFLLIVTAFEVSLEQDIDDELDNYKPFESYVELKGGEFLMGINDKQGVNFEFPQKKGILKPFRISLYPTTVASFKKYRIQKYGFRTDAEQTGYSWVLRNLIDDHAEVYNSKNLEDDESKEAIKNGMTPVVEARWNRPEGGDSTIINVLDFPVVHVSYEDAFGYCAWKNMRLPTEIEWEFAARGGLKEKLYPWGDKWEQRRANLWQGKFPDENLLKDGYYGLSPVNEFPPQNAYEMYDMIGNIWEWTSSIYKDVYNKSLNKINKRVLKGGSFLDDRKGDFRNEKMKIRISSRIGKTSKFTAQNIGFRCAQSIDPEEYYNFDGKNFKVIKLRPPVHHHIDEEESHYINDKRKLKSEL